MFLNVVLNVLWMICYVPVVIYFIYKYVKGRRTNHRDPIWMLWYILLIFSPAIKGILLISEGNQWGIFGVAIALIFLVLVFKHEIDMVHEVL